MQWAVCFLLRAAVAAWMTWRRLCTCCTVALWGDDSVAPILRRKTVLRLANAAVDSRSPTRARVGSAWGLGFAVGALHRLYDAAFSRAVARRAGLTSAHWPRYTFPVGAVEVSYTAYDFSFLGRPVTVVVKREHGAGRPGAEPGAEPGGLDEVPGGPDEEADALVAASLHGPPHLLATLWKTCFSSGIDASDFFDRFGASMRVGRGTGLRLGDLVYVAHALGCAPPHLLAAILLAASQKPAFHVDITSLNTGSSYLVRGRGGDEAALPPLPVFE